MKHHDKQCKLMDVHRLVVEAIARHERKYYRKIQIKFKVMTLIIFLHRSMLSSNLNKTSANSSMSQSVQMKMNANLNQKVMRQINMDIFKTIVQSKRRVVLTSADRE